MDVDYKELCRECFGTTDVNELRQIAAGLQVSHMTVVRRLERIQEKLSPLKGWLRRMAEERM